MFKFYLVSAARHMVTDIDSSTTCRSNFKAPSLEIDTKKPSQKHGFHPITVSRFQNEKKTKNPVLAWKINKRNARPSAKTEHGACSQEEINWSKIEKGFRIKLLELFKTRTNKSILDLFNFYVVSVGHDMVTDVGRATRRRRKFNVQSVQKIKDLPKTRVLTGKQFENFRQKN